MYEDYLTRGIVLKGRAHQEDSTEVVLFSENIGRVRAVAQAAKRTGATFAAGTQPGVSADFALIKGRYVWRVRGIYKLKYPFQELSGENREAYLQTLGLFARFLPENEPQVELFNKLSNLPAELIKEGEVAQIRLIYCMLGVLGYADASKEFSDLPSLIRSVNESIRAAQLQ